MEERCFYFSSFKTYRKKVKRAIINYLRLILLKEPSFFLVVALNEAINNALFHSDVQPVEVWVKIRVSNHNRKIFIRVKNNGSGFDGNARLKELKDNPKALFDHRLFEVLRQMLG